MLGNFVPSCKEPHLQSLIPKISDFLSMELGLTLHPRKRYLQHYRKGVVFLGMKIKPYCIVAGRHIKGNFYQSIMHHNELAQKCKPNKEQQMAFLCSMNSYLGIMKHYNTYGFRKKTLVKHVSAWWWNIMYCSGGCAKLVSKIRVCRK